MWSLMLKKSKGINLTSNINVFAVSKIILFLLGGRKMNLFFPHGEKNHFMIR